MVRIPMLSIPSSRRTVVWGSWLGFLQLTTSKTTKSIDHVTVNYSHCGTILEFATWQISNDDPSPRELCAKSFTPLWSAPIAMPMLPRNGFRKMTTIMESDPAIPFSFLLQSHSTIVLPIFRKMMSQGSTSGRCLKATKKPTVT